MSKYTQYLEEIKAGWDWPGLAQDCKDNAEEEDGQLVGTAYLGNILYITPSGKVYTPWANSNVDRCPHCKGNGHTRNPRYRKQQYERLRRKHMRLFRLSDHPNVQKLRHSIFRKMERLSPTIHCNHCGGLGSIEAFHDQEWHEALEKVADQHGLFVTSDEGDGCILRVGGCFGPAPEEDDEDWGEEEIAATYG